jgi:hypothetical protein
VVLDAKKKSCGFVLSVTNFEAKKKERKKERIFRHLMYSNEEVVPRLHPERNYETNIVKEIL